MSITWAQALAWRLERQLLDPVGHTSVGDVVSRLGAVPAMDDSPTGLAELAVGMRRVGSHPGDVAAALADGRLVKAFAFRGATHYLSPQDGGAYLALRAAGRQWERPSWQEFYGLGPKEWPGFRATVEALADGPLTVGELGREVARRPAYRHLGPVFADGAGTLVKPLTWQGDMSIGPRRNGEPTFRRLDDTPHWAGVWDLDEAGPYAIAAYLRAYGPATPDHVHYWLGNGLSAGRQRLQAWLAGLADRLVEVDLAGESALVMGEDVDDLVAARPTTGVRLLPGHDPWVIGPGTKDRHVVPPAHRTAVTRKANLVLVAGVVSGTWAVAPGEVRFTWFGELGPPPRADLDEQVARLAEVLDRPLEGVLDG